MSRAFPFWMSCFGGGGSLFALVEGCEQRSAIIITAAAVLLFANVFFASLFVSDM